MRLAVVARGLPELADPTLGRFEVDQALALAGAGVVGAGARLVLNTEMDDIDEDLVVHALPWSVVVVDGVAEVVTAQPWGVIVDSAGNTSPALSEPADDLGELLEVAQAMGAHPGL